MIVHEEKRLRETFQRLLLLALAAPAAAQACSSSSSSPGGNNGTADGGSDATTSHMDAALDTSSAVDSGAEAAENMGDGGGYDGPDLDSPACQPSAPYVTDAAFAQLPDSGPDAPYQQCYYFIDFPCGTNYLTGTGQSACYLYIKECANICDAGFRDCHYWEGEGCLDGSLTAEVGQPATVACGICGGVGRRPAGLLGAKTRRARDPLGDYLAEVAHLEAASVFAFERLRDELRSCGAPSSLVRCAHRSIRDEERHARMTTRLAKRFGAQPATPRVRRSPLRKLEEIAIENAVEGCVRETFGAMMATWQAEHAQDEDIRTSMVKIARDETRHAALAWAVAKWADRKLDAASRQRVARARRRGARRLARDVMVTLPASASRRAGLPTRAQAQALIVAMQTMWT